MKWYNVNSIFKSKNLDINTDIRKWKVNLREEYFFNMSYSYGTDFF